MKTVLITGSAGFVGSHLVEHILAKTDWNIVGLDSFRHRGDALRIQDDMDPKRYRILTCDLSTPISHRMIEKIGPVDFIVNMASESHVDRSITDPVPFVQNNVNLALNMLEYARVVKPRQFIQISTDEVYGAAPQGMNHAEWSCVLPSNPYAAAKASQEALAISYWRTYGVPVIITNTMNMFGERQDTEKFIPMLISKINAGDEVTIHGNEDFIGSRFYLHARNHADALLWIMQTREPVMYEDNPHSVVVPERFNIVGEVELDNLQLASYVASTLKKELKYKLLDFHAARPGHDRRYALDGKKIADLGWRAPRSFIASIDQTIQWTLNHPEWLR